MIHAVFYEFSYVENNQLPRILPPIKTDLKNSNALSKNNFYNQTDFFQKNILKPADSFSIPGSLTYDPAENPAGCAQHGIVQREDNEDNADPQRSKEP